MKAVLRIGALAIALLSGSVQAQLLESESVWFADDLEPDAGPEVTRIVIDDLAVASPGLRALAISRRIDRDYDQYVTVEEINVVLTAANLEVARIERQLGDLIRSERDARRRGVYNPYYGFSEWSARQALQVAQQRRQNLFIAARQLMAQGAYEISIMDEGFYRRFGDLPAEQRNALVAADVAGDNNGVVTGAEFHSHTRRRFFKTTRFERDFGEEAYVEVAQILGIF